MFFIPHWNVLNIFVLLQCSYLSKLHRQGLWCVLKPPAHSDSDQNVALLMGRISDNLGHSCISREQALLSPKESWCRLGAHPPWRSRSSRSPSNKSAVRWDVSGQEETQHQAFTGAGHTGTSAWHAPACQAPRRKAGAQHRLNCLDTV